MVSNALLVTDQDRKGEAIAAYARICSDPDNLCSVEGHDSRSPSYDIRDIREAVIQHEIRRIHSESIGPVRKLYDMAGTTNRDIDKWIIRWFLWHAALKQCNLYRCYRQETDAMDGDSFDHCRRHDTQGAEPDKDDVSNDGAAKQHERDVQNDFDDDLVDCLLCGQVFDIHI